MLKNNIQRELKYINEFEYESLYQELLMKNDYLRERVAISQDELSDLLIKTGISKSICSLWRDRTNSKGISYIQLTKGGRVLYTIVFILEKLGITIENKALFIEKQLKLVFGNNIVSLKEKDFAKILGVKTATLRSWVQNELIDSSFYEIRIGQIEFNISNIIKFMLLNSTELLNEKDVKAS